MWRSFLLALIATLACGASRAAAQETHPVKDDPSRPTHGIVRRAPAKPADTAKPTAEGTKTVPEDTKPPSEGTKASAQPTKLAPPASTEAVAAAIANAMRSADEKKKEAVRPRPVRPEPQRVSAPQRRYAVRWPSPRLQVHWGTPEDRISLSWSATDRLAGNERDDHGLVP